MPQSVQLTNPTPQCNEPAIESIRVGLIGYGHWGKNYARVLSELSQTQLVAIADQSTQAVQKAAERHSQVFSTTSIDEVLDSDELDAIVIATSASTHHSLAGQALANGKHVIVEKPLALTSHQCQELVELADTKELCLQVGHTFLYNDSVQKIKQILY